MDEDWHAFSKASSSGVQEKEWQAMHETCREMRQELQVAIGGRGVRVRTL